MMHFTQISFVIFLRSDKGNEKGKYGYSDNGNDNQKMYMVSFKRAQWFEIHITESYMKNLLNNNTLFLTL